MFHTYKHYLFGGLVDYTVLEGKVLLSYKNSKSVFKRNNFVKVIFNIIL